MSFLETGRAQPSRDMILHLADRLEVPLRERNVLLVAGGYAPVFPQRPLADAALDSARKAVDLVLAGHEPHPALAIDGHWTMVAANRAVTRLIAGVDPLLLRPPVNVLRLSLHPAGLAPRIANFCEWRAHLLARVRRQIDCHGRSGARRADAGAARIFGASRRGSDRTRRPATCRRGRAAQARHGPTCEELDLFFC